MKKETKKKSKLWLWLLLALLALAIIGGVVAAFVLPGLMQPEGPTGPVAEAKLYWNLDRLQWLEEETNMSAREKAEDGYFHMRYAFDGKVEELKITDDKRLVNYLDSQDLICLAFDENGIVVDCAPASTYFTPAAKDLYTKRVQGNILQLNSSMAMNGMDMEIDISGIHVYEVAEGSENKGSLTTPQWLDVVTVYNDLEGKPYAAYVTGHLAIDAEIGWRVESSMYNASTGYKRTPDKDGVYTIPFAINGEIVNRYIKNYDMAISIESQSMYSAYFALEYDEDGYIIDWENPALALQGTQLCQAFNVDSVQDGYVTATRYLSGNNQGETVEFTYDETCEIYQCCIGGCYDDHCGERIDSLQVGDMINVFTDLDGKPVLIYVSVRTVDGPAYYNVYQKYSWTDLASNRVPDENGYYVYEMAVNGGMKTVRTKSKAIADQIDGNHNRAMGLKLSGSVVKKVYGIQCVSGRGIAFGGRFVTSYNKPIVSVAATSDITNVANWVMADGCKIYTVEENYGVKLGSKSDIKVGDKVLGLMNAQGELCYIFVQQTYQSGFKMGYSMARKYSTVTNATTRIPDEEGYYVYDVAYNGKVIQLKTKNKKMADFIDLQNAPVFGFKEKNGIITDVCTAASAVPYGQKAYNYNNIENMNGGVLTSWYMNQGVKTLGTAQWKITSKTKTYNVSKGYEDHPGEKSKPKVGDRIQAIVNTSTGAIEYIFIMNRPVDSPIYWMVSRVAPRYVDGVLAGSNRVPDEDGYYVFDLLVDGKIKQYKTKDEMIAAQVDTYTQGLGLKLKEGTNIIERVVAITDTKYPTTAIGNADVKSIKGRTISTERCRLTSSNYGEKLTVKLGKNVKIYNVSSYAENWGAADKLEVGDRIVAYTNLEGEIAYVFITKAAAREKGSWGYCDHCGKTVFWDSYSETLAADGHYYLPVDTERTAITFGSTTDDAVYDQVFDLNGHSLKSTGSAFIVNDKLTILDSVGGGKVINGKGISMNGSKQGGNVFVGEGGTFTLLSGTIADGAVGLSGIGSNISAFNGTVNIKGGTISGGIGYLGTAVYHSGTKGGINISGGKLAGSVYAEESKKITLSGKPTIEKLIVAPGNLVKLGALKSGAKITVKGDGIFTTESDDIKTLKNYFVPANSKDTITISGKALKYNNLSGEQVIPEPESPNKPLELDKNGVGMCVLCGEDVQWIALRNGEVIGDMNPVHTDTYNAERFGGDQKHFHYYVAEDMTAGDGDFLFGWQNMSVCLHLNGKTLNVHSGFYGGNGATINIYGNGKVHNLGTATKSYIPGYMFECYTSNVNIYGGEFTSDTGMIHGAGSAFRLSISDEAIINGNVKMDYGNVSISGGVEIKRIALGETAKLTISRLFKGNTSLSVAAGLEEGNLIPEANAAVLGKYTGKLTYADFRDIVYTNGRLKVVGEAPSPNDTLVLDENDMGICYVCGEKVQWTALRGGDSIGDVHSDGQTVHYYVAEDMTAAEGNFQFLRDKSENVAVKASATICLHLNDHILNVKGILENGHGSTTNIMGNGVMLNGGSQELLQNYSATLNLYGGEYYGGDYPVFKALTEASKLNVMGDAKLYGNVELPFSGLSLKEEARIDNVVLGNTTTQKDIDQDGKLDDVTVYGKVTVGAGWTGKAKLTVASANMDGNLLKAESGVALGDFTGVLINQDGKKFVNSDGMLKLTSKTGTIPAAPAAPKAPAVATPPVPAGINDKLVLDSENKAMCVHCGEEVVWTPIANGEKIGDVEKGNTLKHYYLTEDNVSTGQFMRHVGTGDATKKGEICLHLNGHNLTTQTGFSLQNGGVMNIMGNGNVTRSSSGMLFEVWTCTVNIYGGSYTSDVAMAAKSGNSVISVVGDTTFNGKVQLTAGRTYFAHNVSADKVEITGSGKLQLANNWNGAFEIVVADSLMDGDLVKKSAVELIGAVDGTITHEEGVVTVKEGQLCITLPEPETPVWGVFNPEACDNKAYCPACGYEAGVIEWTKISTAADYPGYMVDESDKDDNNNGAIVAVADKHYYLSADIDYSGAGGQWLGLNKVGACVHLNGHTLNSASRIFATGTSAYLNIIAGDGGAFKYTGANHQGGIVTNVPTNIYGGTYTSTQATDAAVYKPIIQVTAGTTNLYDVTVNGRTEVGSGTIIVNGTTSANNLALDTYMTDASGATANTRGKLVIAEGWSGNITLTVKESDIVDGLISSSRVVVNGDFTGTVTLSDGRKTQKEGTQLKVETSAPPAFDPTAATNWCEHCKKNVAWQPLNAGEHFGGLTGQHYHYYVAENMTSGAVQGGNYTGILPDLGADTANKFKLCLQLNGKELTTQGMFYCGRQWQINIMGDGKVINGGADDLFLVWTCDVNLYGGTYVANANTTKSVISMQGGNAKVYLHNDVEVQGKVTAAAGNLYLNDKASVTDLQITGGKLTIADGWDGKIGLTVPAADIVDDLISASRVVVGGNFTGTVTMADGKNAVKDGTQLRVGGAPAPTGELVLSSDNIGFCEACQADVKWTQFTQRVSNVQSGHQHYYLADDVTLTNLQWQPFGVQNTGSICFHFNGYTLTTNTRIFQTGTGKINLITQNGGWVCTGVVPAEFENAQETGVGRGLNVAGSGGIHIYGGTYTSQTATVPIAYANGPLVLKDATLNGFVQVHNSSSANITLKGSTTISGGVQWLGTNGKVTVDTAWSGSATLTLPTGAVENSAVKAANGVANGDFTGTLKLSTGEKLVNNNGTLTVQQTNPVQGIFDPWNFGGLAYCDACGTIKTWEVYTGQYAETTLSEAGVTHHHYYLDKDVNYETANYLKTYENICFHLNGHKLTATGSVATYPISCSQQLCLMGEGVVTGGASSTTSSGSVLHVNGGNASSSLKVYGGTYLKPANSTNPLLYVGGNGGRVYIYGGTFDVNGATAAANYGNLIDVEGQTKNTQDKPCLAVVNILGGTLNGDIRIGARSSGATYIGAATLNVTGGNINGKITMVNGRACVMTLGGAAVVKEISVAADSKLTVKANFTGKAAVDFAAGLVEGKVPAANGVAEGAFTGILSLTGGDALIADGTTLKVPANNAYLKDLQFTTGTKMAVCPLCGGDPVEWTDITTKDDKRIGFQKNLSHLHLYLSDDLVASESAQFAELQNTPACFHLNGHNLTTSSRFVVSYTTVNILGRGNVVFEGDCANSSTKEETLAGYNSVGFEVSTEGILNFYGGSYATAGEALKAGKPVMKVSTATSAINLFDVNVTGTVQVVNGNIGLDASAQVEKLTVTTNGKLNVAGTYTGSVVASLASGLVADEVPAANGSSTGAFTGSVTLTDGTVLIGEGGKLIKKPATT